MKYIFPPPIGAAINIWMYESIMEGSEALVHFLLSILGQAMLGILFDWINFRLGQPWYKFPTKRMFYITFLQVIVIFSIAYWISFVILSIV